MAKPELGTKRVCMECSTRYFDLNRQPIACPKCGAIFEIATRDKTRPADAEPEKKVAEDPSSEPGAVAKKDADDDTNVADDADDDTDVTDDADADDEAKIISLEEAEKAEGDDDDDDDDAITTLPDDDLVIDDDDDVSDIVAGGDDDDET